MDTLSFLLCTLGLVCVIAAGLVKGSRMTAILILLVCGNLLYAFGYLAGGSGIGGSAACFLGAAIAFVKYFFDIRKKPLPVWIMAAYLIVFSALNIYLGGIGLPTVLMIICALAFLLSVIQPNGARFRLWSILNSVTWCIYDPVTGSFGALPAHILQLGFFLIGVFWHDLPHKNASAKN